MLLRFSYSHTTCTKNLRITHSLFSFQRSNFVFVTKLLSLATLISYHIRTNFASIFFKFLFSKLICFACRTIFLGVFLAGIRIYHVHKHYASTFFKKSSPPYFRSLKRLMLTFIEMIRFGRTSASSKETSYPALSPIAFLTHAQSLQYSFA